MHETAGAQAPKTEWLDIVNPQLADFLKIHQEFGIPLEPLEDCLKPIHLPHFVQEGGISYLFMRAVDDSECLAHTVQDVTRKLVVFWGENFVITIRRVEQKYFSDIASRIHELTQKLETTTAKGPPVFRVLELIVQGVLRSYTLASELGERNADEVGKHMHLSSSKIKTLTKMHQNMHRSSLQRRALLRNIAVVENSVESFAHFRKDRWKRIIQEGKRTLYVMEEVEQGIANRLNLELSLANLKIAEESQKTSEVMRTLTLFSVIFMPLTLIAGIYGMNFKVLPELNWNFGYYYALGLMMLIAALLTLWFLRKGYLPSKP